MKKFLIVLMLSAVAGISGISVSAQGNVKLGPDPSTLRDPELEKDSLHNLEVARHYFKLKKAYVAALKRCEEIDAGNPNFAQMDEVLFIAGESYFRLSENKGKQTYKGKTTDELRTEARIYLSRLVTEHPQSTFRKQAEDELQALGGPLPTPDAAKP